MEIEVAAVLVEQSVKTKAAVVVMVKRYLHSSTVKIRASVGGDWFRPVLHGRAVFILTREPHHPCLYCLLNRLQTNPNHAWPSHVGGHRIHSAL